MLLRQKTCIGVLPIILFLTLFFGEAGFGRCAYDYQGNDITTLRTANSPFSTLAVHNVGRIGMTITNKGQFGTVMPILPTL